MEEMIKAVENSTKSTDLAKQVADLAKANGVSLLDLADQLLELATGSSVGDLLLDVADQLREQATGSSVEDNAMTYTHIFINWTKQMVPIADAPQAVASIDAWVGGFVLVDKNRVKFDQHGKPSHRSGGWSYGHVQNGYICAGAGGLNSMRVIEI